MRSGTIRRGLKFYGSIVKDSKHLIDSNAIKKLYSLVLIQVGFSLVDLIGVILLGLLVTSALDRSQSLASNKLSSAFVDILGVQNFQTFLLYLSILVAALFILKNTASSFVSWKTFNFLANQQTLFSKKYLKEILDADFQKIRKENPETLAYALNEGSTAAIIGVIGNLVNLISDACLLILLFVSLIIYQPLTGLLTLLYFAIISIIISYFVQRRISEYASRAIKSNIEYRTTVASILRLFREIRILRTKDFYEKKLAEIKRENSNVNAMSNWLSQIPKAILESAMLIGLLILIVLFSISQGSTANYGMLGIYLASATRLIPAILRTQSSVFLIRNSIPGAQKGLSLLISLNESKNNSLVNQTKPIISKELANFIVFREVSFSYRDMPNQLVFEGLNLQFKKGERVAITGPSGGGKSTLADLMLGLLTPIQGEILIEGISNSKWIDSNTGSIAYLPQDTQVINGTVLENICIGQDESQINWDSLNLILESAMFTNVVKRLEFGLNTQISASNVLLSGGEKQRLGIARTLYTQPSVIIMDEATSSMDNELENQFLKSINTISQDKTILYIAHRHNSLRNFNRILYVDQGRLLVDGDYDTVFNKNSDTQKQT